MPDRLKSKYFSITWLQIWLPMNGEKMTLHFRLKFHRKNSPGNDIERKLCKWVCFEAIKAKMIAIFVAVVCKWIAFSKTELMAWIWRKLAQSLHSDLHSCVMCACIKVGSEYPCWQFHSRDSGMIDEFSPAPSVCLLYTAVSQGAFSPTATVSLGNRNGSLHRTQHMQKKRAHMLSSASTPHKQRLGWETTFSWDEKMFPGSYSISFSFWSMHSTYHSKYHHWVKRLL